MVTTEKVQKLSVWHLIAGIIMAALGIFVWFNPMASLVAMALYLGIVFIVVGAGYFMASFAYRSGWYLLVGFLDMLVGVIFVANLGVTAASLPIILPCGVWPSGRCKLFRPFSCATAAFPGGGRLRQEFWACYLPF